MRLSCVFIMLPLALAALFAIPSHAKPNDSGKYPTSFRTFDIGGVPSQADWKFFIHAPERARIQLWEKNARIGKQLAAWNWGWRLGWVRTCSISGHRICQEILRQALFDKALVVRSEAAVRLGSLFAGTAHPNVVALLEQAYVNKANVRAGRPLFVLQRILYALYQVGDETQRERAEALAAQHSETKVYWRRLVTATEAAEG